MGNEASLFMHLHVSYRSTYDHDHVLGFVDCFPACSLQSQRSRASHFMSVEVVATGMESTDQHPFEEPIKGSR